MPLQEQIEKIIKHEVSLHSPENINNESDLANCREIARQRAVEISAWQRDGWRNGDYETLYLAVRRAVYDKLLGHEPGYSEAQAAARRESFVREPDEWYAIFD